MDQSGSDFARTTKEEVTKNWKHHCWHSMEFEVSHRKRLQLLTCHRLVVVAPTSGSRIVFQRDGVNT